MDATSGPDTPGGPAATASGAHPGTDAPERPPLRRPREGRMLAGVASGLAAHLGVDVVIVRLVFVLLAVITEGVGVLAYLAAAVFIPAADGPPAHPSEATRPGRERDPLFWIGFGALVLGALWLVGGGLVGPFRFVGMGELLVPLALIGFGLALWRAGDRRSQPASPVPTWTPAATPATTAATPVTAGFPTHHPSPERAMSTETPYGATPSDSGDTDWTPPPPSGPSAPGDTSGWTPPPEPGAGERSLLARTTLGLALVTLGVMWALRVSGVLVIGWGTILAATLLVIGLGLLIGSVIGRGRGLIVAGALLAPVVLLAQLGALPTLGDDWTVGSVTAGEISVAPTDLGGLRPEYQVGAGSVRLDLSGLDLAGESVSVRVDAGAGEIDVLVPDDVTVEVVARSGIGQVTLFEGRRSEGIGAGEQRATFTPEGTPQGQIRLELQVGLGEIEVAAKPRGAPSPADD